MAQLAIKGHPERGKEVIELLEMLGGENKYHINITEGNLLYTIREGDDAIIATYPNSSISQIYTLEEFEEKFPYKVGDKVCFPDDLSTPFTINKMWWDENANELLCSFIEDDIEVPVVGIRTYKEKSIDKSNKVIFETNAQCCDIRNEIIKKDMKQIKIDIPKGYEFFGIDDDNKIVLTEKQLQYPKTYKECCRIIDYYLTGATIIGYEKPLLENLQRLLICRDAYWKIAGEQMGLSKPWESDFTNNDEERYGIYTLANKVEKDFCGVGDVNMILTFPTEEMRDAFFDNFKDLIEQCKELL